ncbi:MAG TPA: response regulator [Nitrososphaeraceae archaeon]|nr:response regulator [Nitrososphaeraceae archaeon]
MSLTLTNVSSNEHIMILYKNDDDRKYGVVKYINEGLKNGVQCIYAFVDVCKSKSNSILSTLSSNIDNYKENIERGELCIVDFKLYYDSVLNADFRPFKKLKMTLEETLNHRSTEGKKDEILILLDVACLLFQNKHFDVSEILESWWNKTTAEWRQKNKHISVICPHNEVILNNPLLLEKKTRMSSMHTKTIDLNQYLQNQTKQKKNKKIIILESEPDIQYLYSIFKTQYGLDRLDIILIENGEKGLEYIISRDDNINDHDIVIIDTHLRDIPGFEVAKQIRDKLPKVRIILTTTFSFNNIKNIVDSIGIKCEDVILKPFSFSELISVIEEQ